MSAKNYKETLNLPKTDFPMKADLVKREPERLAKWEAAGSLRADPGGPRPGRRSSCCTTGRPLPMATSTWAPR